MVVVAFGLVSMRKRRRWTVTRSVLVRCVRQRRHDCFWDQSGSASERCVARAREGIGQDD